MNVARQDAFANTGFAFQRNRVRSLEAGVKYLILGALSSAVLVYGIALVLMSAYLVYSIATRGSFEEGALAALLIVASGIFPVILLIRLADTAEKRAALSPAVLPGAVNA